MRQTLLVRRPSSLPLALLVTVVVLLAACTADEPTQTTSSSPEIRQLPSSASADYQLGGAYEPEEDVTVVVRDREDPADPARYSVCYVNAFQTQPGDLAWWEREHSDLLLRDEGELVEDPDWPDEYLLDFRGEDRRRELTTILTDWFTQCAQDGYQAVEPDNLDSFTRSGGLLNQEQTEAMAAAMTEAAHDAGLAIAQKNTAELDGPALGFDFAVVEECEVYDECGTYLEHYPGRVVEIEYTDNGREAFTRACAERGGEHPIQLRDRDLLPAGEPGHVARRC